MISLRVLNFLCEAIFEQHPIGQLLVEAIVHCQKIEFLPGVR